MENICEINLHKSDSNVLGNNGMLIRCIGLDSLRRLSQNSDVFLYFYLMKYQMKLGSLRCKYFPYEPIYE